MKNPKIAFQTLGCKLNFSESSDMSHKLKDEGFDIVPYKEKADYYVVNSCTVTQQADKKCRAAIRQAKRRNPNSVVIVAGCLPQIKAEELFNIEGVEIVLGNAEKPDIYKYIHQYEDTGKKILAFQKTNEIRSFYPSASFGDRTRSFVKVQDGCDYYCSYCIIPEVRGRSRSDTISDTVRKITDLSKNNIKEVILTGVNIGDFGKNNNENLLGLINELDKISGIERYRISSIEPDLLTDDIINFIARSKKFLPHFHIPLQSGSNSILKAMNRKYSRELFAGRVEKINSILPDACIAADVIVGFPGETDEDFQESFEFIKNLDLSYVHVFSYSERPGTKAAKMNNKVEAHVIKERSKILHELSSQKKLNFYRKNIGLEAKVLFESFVDKGYVYGFSENYIRVKSPYIKEKINNIITVKLENLDEEKVIFVDKR